MSGSATKRLVAAAYDESSAAFAQSADRIVYRHLARPLIDAVGAVTGPVLDVAAGTGAAGRGFGDVVALDLSMGQLRCNATAKRVCADAERLPIRDDAFAAAVCVFGVNHFPDARAAVREMRRVAPVIGVATWARPEPAYPPKQVVLDALARHTGQRRSPMAEAVDALAQNVGTVDAVTELLDAAGLLAEVELCTVVVPWPGIDAFLDYRFSLPSTAGLVADLAAVRRDAARALARLPSSVLDWHTHVIVGIGHRP